MGDIIEIVNDSYQVVASYTYDAWGNVIVTNNTTAKIGDINPFRYRSYYYDTETALYYLNSRYYSPEMGRFINADGIIGANMDLLSYNLYAYVSNNPVMFSDPSGHIKISDILRQIKRIRDALIGKTAIKVVSSVGGAIVNKDRPLTQKMYNHGLFGYGKPLPSTVEKELTNQIMDSPVTKKLVNDAVTGNHCYYGSVRYGSNDLVLSIGKVDVIVEPININQTFLNQTTTFSVVVNDTFDFDELRLKPSFSNAANNFGLVLQYTGHLQPYSWEVKFNMTG